MENNIYRNKLYPRRGEIYYVKQENATTGSETWADRYAVIVSSDKINKNSNVTQVIYVTKKHKNTKTQKIMHVDISTRSINRIALCEQVTPVDKSRLIEYKGFIPMHQMREINKAIQYSLDLQN